MPASPGLTHVQEGLMEWVSGLLPGDQQAKADGAVQAASVLLDPSTERTLAKAGWLMHGSYLCIPSSNEAIDVYCKLHIRESPRLLWKKGKGHFFLFLDWTEGGYVAGNVAVDTGCKCDCFCSLGGA
eukprot:1150286-Pelagomonas_calceolata.AAC.3